MGLGVAGTATARTKENNNAAQALFEQALKIDPNEADALAGDAYTYLLEYLRGWTTAGTDYEAKILGQADRAIALAPDNIWAHNAKSLYLTLSQRPNEGLGAAEAGLAINPDYPPLLRARGNSRNFLGRYEQAISDLQQAMRLSPRDPRIGLWLVDLGDAEIGLGHFDAAIDEYQKAIDAGYRAYLPYTDLAAAYALDGKMEEATSALAEARRLNPELTSNGRKPIRDHTAAVGGPAQGGAAGRMSETRKLAAILVADIVGYSRLAGADEDRTLARLRGLRSDLIDPAIAAHHGRIVKRTGDGILIEFRSVVDAVRCAIEVQNGMVERNAGLPPERRIEFRVGIHLGDVVEESRRRSDGRRRQHRRAPRRNREAWRDLSFRGRLSAGERRLDMEVTDLGPTKLKNIEKPIRAYSLEVGKPAKAKPAKAVTPSRRSIAVLLVAGVAALIAIAAGAWHFWGVNRAPVAAARPTFHSRAAVREFERRPRARTIWLMC